jgi:single-strand DNA-binding protein
MDGKNHILISGRLGQNPDLKYTRRQEPVCYFSVAEKVKGSDKPLWHKVIVWGRQAEGCKAILSKGTEVFVRGRIFDREFKNEKGELKKYKEVNADLVGFTFQQ